MLPYRLDECEVESQKVRRTRSFCAPYMESVDQLILVNCLALIRTARQLQLLVSRKVEVQHEFDHAFFPIVSSLARCTRDYTADYSAVFNRSINPLDRHIVNAGTASPRQGRQLIDYFGLCNQSNCAGRGFLGYFAEQHRFPFLFTFPKKVHFPPHSEVMSSDL